MDKSATAATSCSKTKKRSPKYFFPIRPHKRVANLDHRSALEPSVTRLRGQFYGAGSRSVKMEGCKRQYSGPKGMIEALTLASRSFRNDPTRHAGLVEIFDKQHIVALSL
jgi:hypothetical protein